MPKTVVHLVAAARPNFMKVAPLYHALAASDWCDPQVVHTGQHYDANMSDNFFRDLGLPAPAFHLGVGSGSHAEQTGGVMIAYEKVCLEARPDWIVVVGDVNSTAACAMVATKLWIPIVHLEAGLRSGDRRMPEEINRLVTDAIADVLWTPSPDANENLLREGVAESKIDLIGNIMIDSFELLREKIERSESRETLGLDGTDYALLTLHRPSNVDRADTLTAIVDALGRIADDIRLVFVSHPRTMKNLQRFGLSERLTGHGNVDLLHVLAMYEVEAGHRNEARALVQGLRELPNQVSAVLKRREEIGAVAEVIKNARSALYLGRGVNFPTALEGALKLKEISYIHAEAYPTGEMKHGPIALIDEELPTVVVATASALLDKTISNMQEVRARDGLVIAVVNDDDERAAAHAQHVLRVPRTLEALSPIVDAVPLQLLAYEVANRLGRDVDQPRNLAKSVTVE